MAMYKKPVVTPQRPTKRPMPKPKSGKPVLPGGAAMKKTPGAKYKTLPIGPARLMKKPGRVGKAGDGRMVTTRSR